MNNKIWFIDGSHKLFTLKSGKGEFEKRLIEMFPDEEKAILEYSRLVRVKKQYIRC